MSRHYADGLCAVPFLIVSRHAHSRSFSTDPGSGHRHSSPHVRLVVDGGRKDPTDLAARDLPPCELAAGRGERVSGVGRVGQVDRLHEGPVEAALVHEAVLDHGVGDLRPEKQREHELVTQRQSAVGVTYSVCGLDDQATHAVTLHRVDDVAGPGGPHVECGTSRSAQPHTDGVLGDAEGDDDGVLAADCAVDVVGSGGIADHADGSVAERLLGFDGAHHDGDVVAAVEECSDGSTAGATRCADDEYFHEVLLRLFG